MATAVATKTAGGVFLIEDQSPRDVFTPEDLTEEHHDIARTAREFFDKEVAPHVEEMQHGDFDVAVSICCAKPRPWDSNPCSPRNATAAWKWI